MTLQPPIGSKLCSGCYQANYRKLEHTCKAGWGANNRRIGAISRWQVWESQCWRFPRGMADLASMTAGGERFPRKIWHGERPGGSYEEPTRENTYRCILGDRRGRRREWAMAGWVNCTQMERQKLYQDLWIIMPLVSMEVYNGLLIVAVLNSQGRKKKTHGTSLMHVQEFW